MVKEFVRAGTAEEVVSLQEKGFTIIAGGTQINSRAGRKGDGVEHFVSLSSLELDNIVKKEDFLEIGSCVTLQEISDNQLIPAPLRRAAGFIPTRNVRNIATIGGNIGANRPDSYLIPALCALNGSVVCAGGEKVPVFEYISREDRRLITAVSLPRESGTCRVLKESRSHVALPVVSAAVYLDVKEGKIADTRIFAGCAGQHVASLGSAVEYLKGRSGAGVDRADLESRIDAGLEPEADILGSSEYKKYINRELIAQAVINILEEERS